MTSPAGVSEDKAISILCARNLHQCFYLPGTADHPRLRVTYGTTSNFNDSSLPVALFIGPMFGSRWLIVEIDRLARDCGVRVVYPDRPSMGGSSHVALRIRMQVWLETVPALLRKLDVKHVGLVSHSAGTIYTFNTLVKLRHFLDPNNPFVAFIAPWVPVAASNAMLMTAASKLPAPLLDGWSALNRFIGTKILPVAAFSGGLLTSSAAIFEGFGAKQASNAETEPSSLADSAWKYGVDEETARTMPSLFTKYVSAEDNTAGNEEAKLCLQKSDPADWGVAADYMACVRSVTEIEASKAEVNSHSSKLRVHAYFADLDVMIGKGGQAYFESCWRQSGSDVHVNFESHTFEGTSHDSVLIDIRKGALRSVLERLAKRSEDRGN